MSSAGDLIATQGKVWTDYCLRTCKWRNPQGKLQCSTATQVLDVSIAYAVVEVPNQDHRAFQNLRVASLDKDVCNFVTAPEQEHADNPGWREKREGRLDGEVDDWDEEVKRDDLLMT